MRTEGTSGSYRRSSKAMPNSSIIYKPEEEEARELVGKSPLRI